jgi:hypothetical protein
MKLEKLAGATSEIWQIFVRDSSSTTGGGLTGLVFNTASLTAYYHRDTDTTATVINLVTMTVGTFTSSGFKEIDATNMPGWYQFCPPNAAIAAGAKSCAFHLKGATNMAPLPIEVQLTAINPDSATAFMTSVATVTTVTNQLTAAQIATGVWQDATASDFTTASSIGKSLYTGNVAPGGTNGLFIAGTNAATTITTALTTTFTGNLTGSVGSLTTNNDKTGYGLSAAAVSSIWQDTTAGDFTAASSIGKSIMNGVALGTGLTVNDITTKTGYSLSGSQTFNNTGTWTGNIVGTLSTLTTYTGNTPQTGDAYLQLTQAQAEPGQGAPAVNASVVAKISYLYKGFRNKVTQTSTTYSLFADDNATVDQKATVSDDGVTFTRGKIATGP